tara:strand:+ start:9773 stop:10045 length:273 start_codon:yes stop_codon:yes gene_type:complete
MDDLKQRLDAALTRRDTCTRNKDRVQGQLDSARNQVGAVEKEIRDRGVEPEKLDATIEAVTEKAEKLVADLEARIATSEAALEPFVGDEI